MEKEKYRKKDFTPRFKVPFRKEVDKFYKTVNKLSKNPSDAKNFISNYPNRNVVTVHFSPKELQNFLIDAGDHGADLVRIINALNFKYDPLMKEYQPAIPPDINQEIEEYNKERKDFIKKEKAIKGAVKLLCNLRPLPRHSLLTSPYPFSLEGEVIDIDNVNNELIAIQNRLKQAINKYLTLMPYTTKTWTKSLIEEGWEKLGREVVVAKHKQITQKSNFWNEPIAELVDEFKRIGFSDKRAYIITGNLLHFCYPQYKDPEPDLVRQRYTYHKRSTNTK